MEKGCHDPHLEEEVAMLLSEIEMMGGPQILQNHMQNSLQPGISLPSIQQQNPAVNPYNYNYNQVNSNLPWENSELNNISRPFSSSGPGVPLGNAGLGALK
jgi:hypothetical protein